MEDYINVVEKEVKEVHKKHIKLHATFTIVKLVQDGMKKATKKAKAEDPFYPTFKSSKTELDN